MADAYRWNDESAQAIRSYRQALVEFAQDRAKQQLTANDEVFALYYQQALARLTGEGAVAAPMKASLANLDIAAMPASHQFKVAVLYRWLGEESKARDALALAQQACPVYGRGVDVAGLAGGNAVSTRGG